MLLFPLLSPLNHLALLNLSVIYSEEEAATGLADQESEAWNK